MDCEIDARSPTPATSVTTPVNTPATPSVRGTAQVQTKPRKPTALAAPPRIIAAQGAPPKMIAGSKSRLQVLRGPASNSPTPTTSGTPPIEATDIAGPKLRNIPFEYVSEIESSAEGSDISVNDEGRTTMPALTALGTDLHGDGGTLSDDILTVMKPLNLNFPDQNLSIYLEKIAGDLIATSYYTADANNAAIKSLEVQLRRNLECAVRVHEQIVMLQAQDPRRLLHASLKSLTQPMLEKELKESGVGDDLLTRVDKMLEDREAVYRVATSGVQETGPLDKVLANTMAAVYGSKAIDADPPSTTIGTGGHLRQRTANSAKKNTVKRSRRHTEAEESSEDKPQSGGRQSQRLNAVKPGSSDNTGKTKIPRSDNTKKRKKQDRTDGESTDIDPEMIGFIVQDTPSRRRKKRRPSQFFDDQAHVGLASADEETESESESESEASVKSESTGKVLDGEAQENEIPIDVDFCDLDDELADPDCQGVETGDAEKETVKVPASLEEDNKIEIAELIKNSNMGEKNTKTGRTKTKKAKRYSRKQEKISKGQVYSTSEEDSVMEEPSDDI